MKWILWSLLAALVLGAMVLVLARIDRGEPLASPTPEQTREAPEPGLDAARPAAAHPQPKHPAGASESPNTSSTPATDGAPLRERFVALDTAARTGDAQAACELGAELVRCAIAEDMAPHNSDDAYAELLARQQMDEATLQRGIDALAAQRNILERVREHCAGLPSDPLRDAPRYLAMAAIAGHRPSRVAFLSGDQLRAGALLRDATPLEEYRRHAADFFRQALENGELDLLRIWRLSTRRGDWPLAQYLPPDLREPGLVAALIAELTEAQHEAAFPNGIFPPESATPTPAQIARAKTLYARYFANVVPPPPHVEDGDPEKNLRRTLSVDRYRCSEPAG